LPDLERFVAELKRRNVYKVAIAYAVIVWLLTVSDLADVDAELSTFIKY
jgi:hypothetical protein